MDPNPCIGECVEKLTEGFPAFYDLRHQAIYGTCVKMWDAREPVDMITLQQRLKDNAELEEVGGLAYLTSLPDCVPSAANLAYYLNIVAEKWTLRRLLATCGDISTRIYEWEGNVPELLDQAEADVLRIGQAQGTATPAGMKSYVLGAIDRIEEMRRGVGLLWGLRTHFGYYDKKTKGLCRKEMIVLAGRPGTGKTSKALCVALNIAEREQQPVAFFSLEMSAEALTLRALCVLGEVNLTKLGDGFLSEADQKSLEVAALKLAKLPLHIDDTCGMSVLQLRAKARHMVHQHKVKLIVVDYLQLLHTTKRCNNREQEVADISANIKGLAKELDIPVLVLAQLNREVARKKNAKPQLEDLRESGAIEQDADVVELLYKPKDADSSDDDDYQDEIRVNGLIAKNRNGPLADVQYTFKKWCTKYEDAFHNRGKALANPGELATAPKVKANDLPTNEELGW